ncbi:GntR family transcriptional regulator [Rhodococcus sp. NPDC057529]|uniref:GntR family transcriptional regulator n=1 Tax=Rhodococcus sp. NPDC057529 TaxID=3346158 RepID=UPI00366D50CA
MSPSTRVDVVSASIRADILAGRELPGARLALAPLVAKHEASMGVVREALSRLVSQGLVNSEPQQGFRVSPISVEDLMHLTEARCEIEVLVFRQSIEAGGLPWESELMSAHHTLDRTPQMAKDDPRRVADEWTVAHRAFHAALLDACPNKRLRGIAGDLRDAAELYQRWSIPNDPNRDIRGEHKALLDYALAGAVDKACEVLDMHIRHTSDVLLEHSPELGIAQS